MSFSQHAEHLVLLLEVGAAQVAVGVGWVNRLADNPLVAALVRIGHEVRVAVVNCFHGLPREQACILRPYGAVYDSHTS